MRRRAVGIFFICSAVVPLAIVSTAWACGVLASMKVNPKSAAAGQTVTATGVNYANAAQVAAGTFTPVSIRLDTRTATPVATVTPDAGGKISTTFVVPGGTSLGSHVVLGTQTRVADGTPKSGTPGRTTLKVAAAARGKSKGSSSAPVSAWGPSTPGGPGGAGDTVTLDGTASGNPALLPTLLGVLLSVALLGTGMTLVRRTGTANRPLAGI